MRPCVTFMLVSMTICGMTVNVFGHWWSGNSRGRDKWGCFCRYHGNNNGNTTQWVSNPKSQIRTIVGTCTENVGSCPPKQCRIDQSLPWYCPRDGYVCPITKTKDVNCGAFGNFNVDVVDKCGCCKDEGIIINGKVFDSANGDLLPQMKVQITGNFPQTTDANGRFSTTVNSQTARYALTITDPNREFIETVKVVEIPTGFRGPINVEIGMVPRAEAVEIDSTIEFTLPISENANILLRGNSFFNVDRTRYSGTVLASLTFLDTADVSVDSQIPGQFRTVDRYGRVDNLITDGLFSLTLSDSDGKLLRNTAVVVRVRDDMRLWSLSNSGDWELLPVRSLRPPGRGKLSIVTSEFLARVNTGKWINIDKIPGAPRCYFKARIFNEVDGTEILTSDSATFRPGVLGYTSLNQTLRLNLDETKSPSSTCHEVRCPDPSTLLRGFINMTSYESLIIGGVSVPVVTSLKPKLYSDYSDEIQDALLAVLYSAPVNGAYDVYVNFISNATGPFYPNRAVCKKSNADEPAFHVLKPRLPSYQPYPDDVEICTARINITGGYNFNEALMYLTSPPTITVVSGWSQGTNDYFYTSVSSLQQSENVSDYFFACLKYRCSTLNESTTVYLNITTPLIVLNNTFIGGTTETFIKEKRSISTTETVTVPAFYCYGYCKGSFCRDSETGSIDGSFVAPWRLRMGRITSRMKSTIVMIGLRRRHLLLI